jgi:hypothetical protein
MRNRVETGIGAASGMAHQMPTSAIWACFSPQDATVASHGADPRFSSRHAHFAASAEALGAGYLNTRRARKSGRHVKDFSAALALGHVPSPARP